jgi:hypothetical protein
VQWRSELTIVGVIAISRRTPRHLAGAACTCDPAGSWPDPSIALRGFPRIRHRSPRIVRELDASRAIFGLRSVQEVLDAALDQPRMDATMLGLFAGAL